MILNSHKNLINQVQQDPSHFDSCYASHYDKLICLYPDQDEDWIDYWASRLSLFGDTNEVNLEFPLGPVEESNHIIITFNPDYGS